jgi:hypothetical protein
MYPVVTAAKSLAHITQNIIRLTEERCLIMTRDHTQAEMDQNDEAFKNVFQDSEANAASAAESAAQEGATNSLMAKGFSKAEAEAMVKFQWEKIKSLEDSVVKVGKEAWTLGNKVAVATVSAMVAFVVIVGTWRAATQPRKMSEDEIKFRNMQAEIAEIKREGEQTSEMLANMNEVIHNFQNIAAAPTPVLAGEVPAALAAVVDVPVAVEIETPDAPPQETTLTVGQVYRAATPQAQRQIERDVPKIEHDYNKPSVTSCVVTDCLNQHRDEWNRKVNQLNQHKDYSVTMGDGSTTIHVSY